MLQVLRFGCSYEAIADSACSATTIRARRDEWIEAGLFARLKQIALGAYDRMAGLVLHDLAIDGCLTKSPGGGQYAGRSPVDRGKQGMKRPSMTGWYGIRWTGCWPRRAGTTPRYWPRRWASSVISGRCRTRSGFTWTPGTTRRKPAMSRPPRATRI